MWRFENDDIIDIWVDFVNEFVIKMLHISRVLSRRRHSVLNLRSVRLLPNWIILLFLRLQSWQPCLPPSGHQVPRPPHLLASYVQIYLIITHLVWIHNQQQDPGLDYPMSSLWHPLDGSKWVLQITLDPPLWYHPWATPSLKEQLQVYLRNKVILYTQH